MGWLISVLIIILSALVLIKVRKKAARRRVVYVCVYAWLHISQCECLWGYGFDGLQSTCPRPTRNISSVFLDIVSVLLVGLNGKGERNVWLTLTSAWVTRDVDLLIPLPITVSLESLWLKLQYLKMCVCLSSYDCCPDVRGLCHICLNWGWFKSPSGRHLQHPKLSKAKAFWRSSRYPYICKCYSATYDRAWKNKDLYRSILE